MLTLEIITWLVMTYPRCHPESPHVPAAFLAITDRDVAPMSPKYSPDTHHVLTRSPKEKTKETPETPETPTTTQEAIFLGGFLFSEKQTAKASEGTKQNIEKSRPRNARNNNRGSNFFLGFFLFSQKQTAKASEEQNKTWKKADPEIQKKEQQRKEEEANQPRRTPRTPNADRQLQKKNIPWMRSSTSTA